MGVVSFKTSETIQADIEALARMDGVSPGLFCRSIVFAFLGTAMPTARVARKIADRDVLRGLLGELGRHGSLLNQIARKRNLGAASSEIEHDLAAMREAYGAALRAIATALGAGKDP